MRIRALDSIRGILLLQMTLDHFGKPISTYLYQCFGFFSAAEGFFFLSGFVCMLAAKSKSNTDKKQRWMLRRAKRIWLYHIVTMLTLSALSFLFLFRIAYYFKPFYAHVFEAHFLSALLIHTPMWLDVLPLYVLFMVLGSKVLPRFVNAKNKRRIFLWWSASLLVWILAQIGVRNSINSLFPSWVNHGDFDPFAWQFLYFTGAASAAIWLTAKDFIRINSKRLLLFISFCIIAFAFCFTWSHGFLPLEKPYDFWISKEHLGLLRTLNFFIFTILIACIVKKWPQALDFSVTATIGKCSLDIYTCHIVLLFLWFSLPVSFRTAFPQNILAAVFTCIFLWVLAKFKTKRAELLKALPKS